MSIADDDEHPLWVTTQFVDRLSDILDAWYECTVEHKTAQNDGYSALNSAGLVMFSSSSFGGQENADDVTVARCRWWNFLNFVGQMQNYDLLLIKKQVCPYLREPFCWQSADSLNETSMHYCCHNVKSKSIVRQARSTTAVLPYDRIFLLSVSRSRDQVLRSW